MSKTINIKFVMDTVCPWCYVGEHRLKKAIDMYKSENPNVEFQLEFLPYQIDPDRDTTSDKLQHYKEKFSAEDFEDFKDRLTKITDSLGINIHFGGVISNSFNSHRLIWWSKQFGKQPQVAENLLHLYFDKNKDIGNFEDLADAAEEAGLDRQKTLEFLKGTEGTEEIKALLQENMVNEIMNVPHFTLNDKLEISGAHGPHYFYDAFDQVLNNEEE